jgi:DMSO/TMAO reductase YedYZ molybdopterin-dependent catalytic subunit
MTTRPSRLLPAMVVAVVGIAQAHAADQPTLGGITITGPSREPVTLSAEELSRLPMTQVNVAFLTEHGTHSAAFEGPLLWTVLQDAGALDPTRHNEQVSQTVAVVGRDGYRAVLAVGEIAPEFEGKQIIVAERMDGKPLDAGHLRVVVPLDKRGGRSVRDIVRIEVSAPSLPQ